MGKVLLPFELDVEMRMYHNKSFPLGIIKANINDYDIWLCNKLINCIYRNNETFDCLEDDIWSVQDGLTFSQGLWMSPPIFASKGFDLIEFNKNMLSNGNYITGTYDEFYIPQKKPYNTYNFNHDYVIFGYDDEKGIFNSAAYLDNKLYTVFDLKYDDYYKGVTRNLASKSGLNFYSINKKYIPTINIEKIRNSLSDYLTSREYTPNNVYGINAWDKLAKYVSMSSGFIDLRYGRAYMEHHYIMYKRIKKLIELSYAKNTELAQEYYNDIYLSSKTIFNLWIKYYISPREYVVQTLSKLILSTNKKEHSIIERFISSLE